VDPLGDSLVALTIAYERAKPLRRRRHRDPQSRAGG
jgi:hypothetical protein